jgi:hypothetical protein
VTATRTRLGSSAHAFARESTFDVGDGLEVESSEHYEVIRKRVLYEDVLLITYHREAGIWFIVLNGLVGAFFLFIGVIITISTRSSSFLPMLILWLAMASPFLIAATLRAILGVDVVSVFGRRSKAVIKYSFRKRRAREVYGRILARVRQVQRNLERELAEEAATPVPMPPVPPAASPAVPPAAGPAA